MAKNHPNKSQAGSSTTGFWETHKVDVPLPFSEYKKPSCDEDYVTGRKKKATKKPKPAPALASLLFSSSVEETNKKKYTQHEAPSGPSAWSMRSGSELFKQPARDETRTNRPGHFNPYYPEPQSDLLEDEEEQMRRAIEESMRSAREDQERQKRRETEEREWLSQLCAELKDEDASSGVNVCSARQKGERRKYSDHSTDSDDFLAVSFSRIAKPTGTGGAKKQSGEKTKTQTHFNQKQSETLKKQPDRENEKKQVDREKQNEKKQVDREKQNEKKQVDWEKENDKKQFDWEKQNDKKQNDQKQVDWEKQNEKKQFDWEKQNDKKQPEPERHSFHETRDERGKKQAHRNETRFVSNLYDDYDDEPESEEVDYSTGRSTYWPSKNESHKWNAETWGGGRSTRGRNGLVSGTRSRNGLPKAQQNSFGAEDVPNTRTKVSDSRYEPPKPARTRHFRQEELPDTRNEMPKETRSSALHVRSQGKPDTAGGSPARSRNFKLDLFKNQTEEDDRKHVKFASEPSTHVISSSEPDTDSSSRADVFASRADVFASSKMNFDESLYSTPHQRGTALSHSRRPARTDKPVGAGGVKPRNTWKTSIETSDEKQPASSSRTKQRDPVVDEKIVERENKLSPEKLNRPGLINGWQQSVSREDNSESDDLGPSISDTTLNDLAAGIDGIQMRPMKASVLDEIKAEVKLPQDNQIYNFYLKKQLGIQNSEEHLIAQPTLSQYGYSDLQPPPPHNNLDMLWPGSHPTPAAYSPFSEYALPPSFDYSLPQSSASQPFQVPYLPLPPSSVQPSYTSSVPPSYTSSVPPSYTSSVPPSYTSSVPPSYTSSLYSHAPSMPHPEEMRTSTPLPQAPPPFPHSSQVFESRSLHENAAWRILLDQARNDLVMLHQVSEYLNRNIENCCDPSQLDTLINMMEDVNTAVQQYQERHAVTPETHNPEVAATTTLPDEVRPVGRGRGKRTEPTRDHVLSSPVPGRGRDYMG